MVVAVILHKWQQRHLPLFLLRLLLLHTDLNHKVLFSSDLLQCYAAHIREFLAHDRHHWILSQLQFQP